MADTWRGLAAVDALARFAYPSVAVGCHDRALLALLRVAQNRDVARQVRTRAHKRLSQIVLALEGEAREQKQTNVDGADQDENMLCVEERKQAAAYLAWVVRAQWFERTGVRW
mmetsp:Transcript_27070/g.68253  ORF Transcript_27070/g.68253 Transcript_27070/m.68253 type:complete len:113 (+) Transcript_27070:356-694(+)